MSDLFTAKRPDGIPLWRLAYERLALMAPGETVTHGELLERLETDDIQLVYLSVARANKELEAANRRIVAIVPGLGYRMLHASEHVGYADGLRKRARRQIGRAKAALDSTRLDELTAEQRSLHHQNSIAFALTWQVLDQHAARLARQDSMIRELKDGVRDVSQRLETLESARIGSEVTP